MCVCKANPRLNFKPEIYFYEYMKLLEIHNLHLLCFYDMY